MSNLFDGLRTALAPGLRVERELGGGGMSRVFVATDLSLERAVVVKVLPPERTAVLSAERFRREILIAARLQHPNIVPVLAAGTADGLLWYSMPFVAGRTLRARIDEDGAMAPAQAVPILRDVARALAFAHRQGIVHRDVKPDNVLLAEDGAASVTDFGIAKALDTARTTGDTDAGLTQAGSSLGTPHYMAPEQIAGDALIDGRADIYALGVVAYEMLFGRRPFDERPRSQVLMAHLTEAPTPIEQRVAGLSPALAELVGRCLAKDPVQRPATADELMVALDGASTTGSLPLVSRSSARRRVALMSTGALIAGGAVLAIALRPDAPATDRQLVAVAPFRVVDGTGELAWLREGMLDLVAAKLTGEGGVKAVAPRTMLAQWRTRQQLGADGARAEASEEDARAVARQLGAGTLLLGEILPGVRGLELHASLVDAQTGEELRRFDARAGRDSVVWMADQLGAQLLTHLAGTGARSAQLLAGVSVDALRPYLDGMSLLRRMHSEDAAAAFARALDADSTFALAGVGAIMAMSWFGGQEGRERAVRVAWSGRERLPARERALLDALLGPRHPARSSSMDVLRAREAYLAVASDAPEAWYLWGDHYFHFGLALGVPDAMQKATDAFKRALALDENYLPGSEHLLEIAVAQRDSALVDRLVALRTSHTGSAFTLQLRSWHRAVLRGDTAMLRVIEDTSASANPYWLRSIVDLALAFDLPLDSPLRIARMALDRPGTEPQRLQRLQMASRLSYATGSPADGLRQLRASAPTPDDPFMLAEIVRIGLLGAGDRAAAAEAVRRLAPLDDAPLAGTDDVVMARREATQALSLWRLQAGDTSRALRDLQRLRAAREQLARPAGGGPRDASIDAHVEVVEALLAARRDKASARAARERLGATLDSLDWSSASLERSVAISLLAARLFAEAGDTTNAYHNALRTHVRFGGLPHPYISVQRRLQREYGGDPVRRR